MFGWLGVMINFLKNRDKIYLIRPGYPISTSDFFSSAQGIRRTLFTTWNVGDVENVTVTDDIMRPTYIFDENLSSTLQGSSQHCRICDHSIFRATQLKIVSTSCWMVSPPSQLAASCMEGSHAPLAESLREFWLSSDNTKRSQVNFELIK
jgi:hypothetical protein